MLVELDIKNFAIIKSLKVRFQEKMTVIIGETGAGKSIIIDAVSLLMGGRGQKEMIRSGEPKSIITGLFELDNQKEKIAELCDQYGLPHDDDQLVISRELAVKGRNVVRINGQLTTINVLREIGNYLVDIHGQHEHQSLLYHARHLEILDEYAKSRIHGLKENTAALYGEYTRLNAKLKSLSLDGESRIREQDFLRFEIDEIENAAVRPGEEES